MEARLGIGRVGGFRLGDYKPYVFMTIDGVARRLMLDDLSITDYEGGNPNTAIVRVIGFEPNEGEAIRIGLGALDANHLIFAGHIKKKKRVYLGWNVAHVVYELSCISWEWKLNRRKVNARFTSTSATDIAIQLLSGYASDFTTDNVEAGLPDIEEISFTNVDLTDALDRLTDRIGAAWYVDEAKDLHLFLSEAETASPITDTYRRASGVSWERDLTPVRTQVTVEGNGVTAVAPAVAGDTALAVDDVLPYDEAGGTVTSGPQRITYTGVVAGGSGAMVGTSVTPSNGPAVSKRTPTGLSAGDYSWKETFGTASGETLPSPASAVVTMGGAVPAPSSAPSVTKAFGGNLNANGVYKWKVAFLDAAGRETLASAQSASLTMDGDLAAPTTIGTASSFSYGDQNMDFNAQYSYKYTFRNHADPSLETTPSPASNSFTSNSMSGRLAKSGVQSPPAGFDRVFYRTEGGGSTYKEMTGSSDGFDSDDANYFYDDAADATLGAAAPSSNTAIYRSATLTSIPTSPDTNITTRRIYRTADGGSVFKKVADIADNTTTTYMDTLADGSLGSTELGTATALYASAALTGIAVGPSGTTSRKLYRTVANGSVWKLLATIADNTTTTYTDTTADGSLGAAAPTSDTSGLVSATGEVQAGSTSLPVSATAPFRSAGGWAFIGSMPIRYTGVSASALTGIPALGNDGSLGTTVRYAVEVVAAPMLVGIPSSGAGSIQYAISTGEDVNILVTEDDLAAQAALADLLTESGEPTADGVIEEFIQDRRLSITEARTRAQARLALVKDPLVTVTYTTFDRFHRSGREVTFNSTLLDLVGTFKIQSVTYTDFNAKFIQFPRRQIVATSRRFSYEAILRQLKAG